MNTRTETRVRALERQAFGDHELTVWRQDEEGLNKYTSAKHAGIELTFEELQARQEPPGGLRIVVQRIA